MSPVPAEPGGDGILQTREGARQVVQSPEQVELHLPVAGPASRILAYVIDYALMLLLQVLIFALLALLFISSTAFSDWVLEPLTELLQGAEGVDADSFSQSVGLLVVVAGLLVLQLVSEWVYFVVMEAATGGRSLGKAWMGLRVVRDGGLPLTLRASLIRNLLRIVDVLPSSYLIGLVSMLLSPEGKRLGDLTAGTLVVRLDRPERARPLGANDPEALGFRFDRDQLARLGSRERALLRQTLRRLDALDPQRAAEVLERSVRALCARIDHPPVPEPERAAFLRALLNASRRRLGGKRA